MNKLKTFVERTKEDDYEGFIENTGCEEWIDLPSFDATEVRTGIRVHEGLSVVKEMVEKCQDNAGFEGYNTAFGTMLHAVGLPLPEQSGFESHEDIEDKRKALTESIDKYSNRLVEGINYTVEDYSDTFRTNLPEVLSKIKSTSKNIETTVDEVGDKFKRKPKLNIARIWQMLHVKSKLPISLQRQSGEEYENIKQIIEILNKAADKVNGTDDEVLGRSSQFKLMFNTTVSIDEDGVNFTQIKAPDVKSVKTGKDIARGAAWGWLAGLFIPLPFTTLIGGVIGASKAEATGSTAEIRKGKDDLKGFVKDITDMKEFVSKIEAVADKLSKNIEKAEDSNKAKKQAVVVMEGLGRVANHILELTYGADKLIDSMVEASK